MGWKKFHGDVAEMGMIFTTDTLPVDTSRARGRGAPLTNRRDYPVIATEDQTNGSCETNYGRQHARSENRVNIVRPPTRQDSTWQSQRSQRPPTCWLRQGAAS